MKKSFIVTVLNVQVYLLFLIAAQGLPNWPLYLYIGLQCLHVHPGNFEHQHQPIFLHQTNILLFSFEHQRWWLTFFHIMIHNHLHVFSFGPTNLTFYLGFQNIFFGSVMVSSKILPSSAPLLFLATLCVFLWFYTIINFLCQPWMNHISFWDFMPYYRSGSIQLVLCFLYMLSIA